MLIIGDSHVHCFRNFITKHGSLHRNSFSLEPPVPRIKLYGISGGQIMKTEDLKELGDHIKLFLPDRLILHIIGNDLDKPGLNKDMVTEVIQKLLALARLYITRYKINHVVLPELMPRHTTRHCAVDNFGNYF